MTALLQIREVKKVAVTTDQALSELVYLMARELGLGKKQAETAASLGTLRVDGLRISITCLETDLHQDAVITAKLSILLDPDAIRHLLEINLIAAIALHATIAIDSDGDPILLALLPIRGMTAGTFAGQLSQMALFATTVQQQVSCR